jgi:adenylate cyclase
MPSLSAHGNDPTHFWCRILPAEALTLGRSATLSTWSVPWDRMISKRHAILLWRDGRLWIQRDPTAKNAIYVNGQPRDEFSLGPGESFKIGDTTFELELEAASTTDQPVAYTELTRSPQELSSHPYTDPSERLEVLSVLPGIIRDSTREPDLELKVTDALLQGIPRAEVAAVVRCTVPTPQAQPLIEVRHVSSHSPAPQQFHPSSRLVTEAVVRRRQGVLHAWQGMGSGLDLREDFTIMPGLDWAICAPLPDEPVPGWALYVSGRLGPSASVLDARDREALLLSDLKFAELVAEIFGSLRQLLDLQRRQAHLTRLLSRQVLSALHEQDIEEVLRPRQTEVTVLFCDLRASCRLAEEGRHDLEELWDRINQALGIITGGISSQDGVIGDFQGDAAMGFWGWPIGEVNQVERAARAALTILRQFRHVSEQPGHPLAGVACGIGIANGQAIAGRLGTYDQLKVSVFGPVVNLASRLETMTKHFRVPILLDEEVAKQLSASQHGTWVRTRRLARVQPFGMTEPLMVSELLLPVIETGALSEQHRRDFEAALDAFLEGRWNDAQRLLNRLSHDGAADFLKDFMQRHNHIPPDPWDGTVVMESK